MSFGLAVHKKRAIVFGGVTDTAGRGDRVYSEQHNELYQYNLELKRWFPVALRVCSAPKTDAQAKEVGRGTRCIKLAQTCYRFIMQVLHQ